jgi:hypothetical protein
VLLPVVFVAVELTVPRLMLELAPAVTVHAFWMVIRTWNVAVAGLAAEAFIAKPPKANRAAASRDFLNIMVILSGQGVRFFLTFIDT